MQRHDLAPHLLVKGHKVFVLAFGTIQFGIGIKIIPDPIDALTAGTVLLLD